MKTEAQPCQEHPQPNVGGPLRKEEGIHCPICLLPTGRRIRGKVYCGNCGFIES